MKVVVPDFYGGFRCIANACPDTCCAGWEIDVDEATLEKYASVSGEFGEKIRNSISDGHFVLGPAERCPLLDENNLCEIQKKLGENFLSEICRGHPRFVEVFGDIREEGLGLCCGEAARLLLASNEPLRFVEFSDGEVPETLDGESLELRDRVLGFRAEILSRLSDRTLPLSTRLSETLCLVATAEGETVQLSELSPERIWTGIWSVLSECESIGESWDRAKSRAMRFENSRTIFSDADGERIVAYQIFRYFAKSLYDGDMLSKAKFAVFFWLLLRRFGGAFAPENPGTVQKINALKLLSGEWEYSGENMEELSKRFASDSFFSTGALLALVRESG